ncbi:MAG: hypothetical protein LH654_01375 [Thermoleophilia bacterium]|nr:hypothetical protein [Thermoleophilia bacterium]
MSVALLLAQTAATLFMAGVIWIVQTVHYPLFAGVGRDEFREYAQGHQRRITPVVGIAMPVEAVTAVLLLHFTPAGVDRSLLVVGAILLLPIWLSTALLQVPAHRRLSAGYDDRAASKLVLTNWLRTSLWSVRSVLILVVLAQAIDA